MAAVAICLTAASCSEESNDIEQELRDNFKALVMGGREVDSLQDWSTASGLDVKIAVDYGNTSVYKVYVLPSPALYDSEAAYLGMAQIRSGESKTITISRPANRNRDRLQRKDSQQWECFWHEQFRRPLERPCDGIP